MLILNTYIRVYAIYIPMYNIRVETHKKDRKFQQYIFILFIVQSSFCFKDKNRIANKEI